MYKKIMDQLNHFLTETLLIPTPLNPDAFQGVFVKKLSNQNIVREKRRISAGNTVSTVNQTHIDVTGRESMLFFFEALNDQTTPIQSIDIDLYCNNYAYLKEINSAQPKRDGQGNTTFVRLAYGAPAGTLANGDEVFHSMACKKYGHTGTQVQINMPDGEEKFSRFHSMAFLNDALVFLKYDDTHYLALLIPEKFCKGLYQATGTAGNLNVNVPVENPAYDPAVADRLAGQRIRNEILAEEVDIASVPNRLRFGVTAGTDIMRLAKARVSQGAFRSLLLLRSHKCCLCGVTVTQALRASHIKEWAKATREERMDAENGLLLCANHDALFDRHLISFHPETGRLCISRSITPRQRRALNLPEDTTISMSERMRSYMRIHYRKFKSGEV